MKQLLNLTGVIPAMNTPFTADDDIDLEGLQRHTAYAVEAGVSAIMIPVVASEVETLTPAERRRIIAATLEVTRGRIPVIGGATAASLDQCLEYVRELTDAGCEGVLANIPYENDAQYSAYVRAIDALHPGFLMIQDYDIGGGGVPAELLARLFDDVGSFRCLKIETHLPGPKFTRMLELTGGRLNVSGGWSITQYIEGLDRGAHAMVPTCMHEVYVRLDSLYRAGHRDAAWRLYRRIQPVICYSNQHPDISKHFYKRMMWRMGYYATPNLRVRTMEIDRWYQRIADDMIDLYLEVSEEVRAGKYDIP